MAMTELYKPFIVMHAILRDYRYLTA